MGKGTVRANYWCFAAALLACSVPDVAAQRLAPLVASARAQADAPVVLRWQSSGEPSAVVPVLLGSVLGVAGFVGGLYAGYAGWTCDGGGVWCLSDGVLVMASAVGALGLAAGTHLGNRRRGSLLYDVLASIGIGAAGLAVTALAQGDDGGGSWGRLWSPALVVIPIAQIVGTVFVEQRVGRARAAAQ